MYFYLLHTFMGAGESQGKKKPLFEQTDGHNAMKKERTLRCPKSPSYLLSCKKRVQVLNLRHIMAIHYEGQRRLKYLQNIPFLLLLRSVNSPSTVWKFHSFSIAQILREMNFGDSRSA